MCQGVISVDAKRQLNNLLSEGF